MMGVYEDMAKDAGYRGKEIPQVASALESQERAAWERMQEEKEMQRQIDEANEEASRTGE